MKFGQWLRFIDTSNSAPALREIFNKNKDIIGKDDVSRLFLSRIELLLSKTKDQKDKLALSNLKEDIQDAIEFSPIGAPKTGPRPKRHTEIDYKLTNNSIIKSQNYTQELNLLDKVERELVIEVFNQCGGKRKFSAQVLGISERGLMRKLNLYREEGFYESH